MPVGNVWAWPSEKVSPEQTEDAMKKFAEEVVELANGYPDFGHPVEIAYQISAEYPHQAKSLAQRLKLAEEIPLLAQLVAASAFDAALHDAFGRANDANSYDLLSSKQMNDDLSIYLDAQFKGEFLDKYTLRKPKDKLPLYHLVGALDPLTDAEVKKPVGDGLPESLAAWIKADGLTHLKIKLAGDNLDWDVDRVLAIDKVAAEANAARGVKWFYSCDFNEKCANANYVSTFCGRVKKKNAAAYDRIQYIEQPTHRDLKAHPGKNARSGQAQADRDRRIAGRLRNAPLGPRAWATAGPPSRRARGRPIRCYWPLPRRSSACSSACRISTCPGASFLQSASLAARIPTTAAVEGNARQYCPAASKPWAKKYPNLFKVTDGKVATGVLNKIGLGF